MIFTITRTSRSKDSNGDTAVCGTWAVQGWLKQDPLTSFILAYTLEREAVMFPPGAYSMRLTPSERAKAGTLWTPRSDFRLPEIIGVVGRTGIRAHALNEASQSDGCVGVGASHTATTIADSRPELEIVCSMLSAAEIRRDSVGLVVTEAFSDRAIDKQR